MTLSRKVKQALKRARELERKEPMTKQELVSTYKEGISLSEKLRNFLKPAWFVKDSNGKKTRKKTQKKNKKKKKNKKNKKKIKNSKKKKSSKTALKKKKASRKKKKK